MIQGFNPFFPHLKSVLKKVFLNNKKIIRNIILMLKFSKVFVVLFVIAVSISSCTKTDTPESKDKKDTTNSNLIVKDSTGEKISLVYKPKVGDIFRYKVFNATAAKELSPITQDKELNTTQDITFYITEEVTEVNDNGTITFKVKYDSISVLQKISSDGKDLSQNYNSNIKDSIYAKPDYVEFNSLINNPFKMRVSPKGEIIEAYELENIHNAVYKAFGDTLSSKDKEIVKEKINSEYFKFYLQNTFQQFPDFSVAKDSVWIKTDEELLTQFPAKRILTYKVSDIKTENGSTIVTIDANLGYEILEKKIQEKGFSATLDEVNTTGTGKIIFNITKGCIVNKTTERNAAMTIGMNIGGQKAKSVQSLYIKSVIELIN